MKVFNKDKALRQIKLKQNKNTYIKKVSIVLSCFILLIGIMYFTFAKFEQNSEEYTLINGKVKYGGSGDVTLSYVVDGVSQNIPPAKGTGYKVKNVDCTNADGTWDKNGWGLYVNNIIGKAKCNIEFELITGIEVTIYSAAEDEIYYLDGEEKVTLGSTDLSGKLENVVLPEGNITLYSTKVKDPDNNSEQYNKNFTIDLNTEIIYLMPVDDCLYWYGYMGTNTNNFNNSINRISYGDGSISINEIKNTNNYTLSIQESSSGFGQYAKRINENGIDIGNFSNIHVLYEYSYSQLYAYIQLTSNPVSKLTYVSNGTYGPNTTPSSIRNISLSRNIKTVTNDVSQLSGDVYIYLSGNINVNGLYTLYALWLE